LDRVCSRAEHFDVAVIIRGGGSVADLNCFDSYLLAAHCAQFPVPVVTGIGHERDDSVVDMVAHTRMKTPTAVAAFLIGQMDEQADELNELQQKICTKTSDVLSGAQTALKWMTARLPSMATYVVERSRTQLFTLTGDLSSAHLFVEKKHSSLVEIKQNMQNRLAAALAEKKRELSLHEQFLKLASPDYILQKGYTLTLKDGKVVRHASELAPGDEITTRFADGKRVAIVQ
jgi:exodeoxyribonuclease VII large subunit